MKAVLTLLTVLFWSIGVIGQTNVRLQINHKLGASPFQFNTAATNNNNVAFQVDRLQYYVSQITLIHDGGQQTLVPNTWFLIDAGSVFDVALGSFNISNLEGVSFGIGVEQSANHLDPSTYPSTHPLAPQWPSMHWGWSAGYRFVAYEGKSGNNFNQTWEIHALEDNLYYQNSITTSGFSLGSDLVIALDADYEKALQDLDVSSGPITHGGFGEAITLLQNFRDYVFSPSLAVGLEEKVEFSMEIGPNPVMESEFVRVTGDFPQGSELELTDLSGKKVKSYPIDGNEYYLERPGTGLYFVSVRSNGQLLATKKLVVLQ